MDDEFNESDKKPKKRKGPRKATAKYLENSAAHYLGRFATSKSHLRQIMMQKVRRSEMHHGTDPTEGAGFIDVIIEKFERLGFWMTPLMQRCAREAFIQKGRPLKVFVLS